MATTSTASDDVFDIVESGYDTIADTYLKWCRDRTVKERKDLIDKVIALLPTGASVLELGCGAGVPITQHLVAGNLQVTGVDISKAQVDLAREHVPGANFIQANMLSSDFEAQFGETISFHSVIAMYSFFHIPLHLQADMLEKMIKWLKPGGLLLFNHNADEGETFHENWMGAPMFSCSPGVEGTRKKLVKYASSITILEDKIVAEPVGKNEAFFHYILLQKE